MKQTRLLMDMPITVEIINREATGEDIDNIFTYFTYIDNTFSIFKESSEITKINKRKICKSDYSQDMRTVLALCEKTKRETNGYFDIKRKNLLDPSGLVKGWAIKNAAWMLKQMGFSDYYIDAGGDIQTSGKNEKGTAWSIGIRNPFNRNEIVKTLGIHNQGVATSGTYIRGQHIYDPHHQSALRSDIVSLTVIGPDIYEADRFATAAFAMGNKGILFIERLPGFEGYMINQKGIAMFSSGFDQYVASN